jgi:hypothetical protein
MEDGYGIMPKEEKQKLVSNLKEAVLKMKKVISKVEETKAKEEKEYESRSSK